MTHQPTYRVTVRVRVTTISQSPAQHCVASRRNLLQSLEGVDECDCKTDYWDYVPKQFQCCKPRRVYYKSLQSVYSYRSMLCIARTMLSQNVRPSVCLSVTRRYSIETAKHIIKLFSPRHSSFIASNGLAIARRGSHNGPPNARGIKIASFDDYLGSSRK